MKTKNSFLLLVILIIGGLLSSGSVFSQGFSDKVIRKNPQNFPVKTLHKPSSSKIQEFKYPCLQPKLSVSPSAPHPDTIASYSTASISMKEYYNYDSLASTVKYLRQYLTPNGWATSFQVVNTYDGTGNDLTSLLQEWRNNSWVDSSRIENTYDLTGNMLTNLLQNIVSSAWVNVNMGTYTYDASGNILTEMDQVWDTTGWVNTNFNTYTYDANGYKLTAQTQQWDGTSWANSSLTTWTYDGTGNMLTALNQFWDGANWVNSGLETYTYDANGNELTYLSQSSYDGITWTNWYQITYTYDTSGNMLTEWDQMWQDPDWMDYSLLTQTWDNNRHRLTYIYQVSYAPGSWQNYSHGIQTYDENGNCLTFINQLWNANAWRNFEKDEYLYQPNMITGNAYGWNGGDWVSKDGAVTIYLNYHGSSISLFTSTGFTYTAIVHYSNWPTGIKDLTNLPSSLLKVYPNPANKFLMLKLNLTNSGQVFFKLTDYSGKTVASYNKGIVQPGGQTFTINTDNIPAGEYILQMNAGYVIEKKKVTIIR